MITTSLLLANNTGGKKIMSKSLLLKLQNFRTERPSGDPL